MRRITVAFTMVMAMALTAAAPAVARRHERPQWWGSPTVRVIGDVAAPQNDTRAQLAALPQQTFTISPGFGLPAQTATGPAVEDVVNAAQPVLPAGAKNGLLRVTVAVSGARPRPVTFALGELDQNFGNHPAYLALTVGDHTLPVPVLVVPGDDGVLRDVPWVRTIRVGLQSPTPTPPPSAGALSVERDGQSSVLTAAQLAALPSQTSTVSFMGPGGLQTHTESGPALGAVLAAAHVPVGLDTWVAAVGSDGYVATVTPAEAWVGGRTLLVSLSEDGQALAQPRLIAGGDVKGGRYVSGVDDLVVGEG